MHGRVRAPPAQVGDDRLADVARQREAVLVGPLAVDHDLAGPPVDVIEAEAGHLAGAQPEAEQDEQHGVVPPALRPAPVAGAEQGIGGPLVDPHRQGGPVPMGNREGRRGQVARCQPLNEATAQERAQRSHKQLRRAR